MAESQPNRGMRNTDHFYIYVFPMMLVS
jgi:hypothetical protein